MINKLSQTEEVKSQDIIEDLIVAISTVYEEFISNDRFDVTMIINLYITQGINLPSSNGDYWSAESLPLRRGSYNRN